MVIFKGIESMCRVGDNKIINAPKRQSMTFHMTIGNFNGYFHLQIGIVNDITFYTYHYRKFLY